MKTAHPLILTGRIEDIDLEPFDRLRQAHFPPDRNFLRAHLTMFHRLPGEYEAPIVDRLLRIAHETDTIIAEVSGVRHLGAGVAYLIESLKLQDVRAALKREFVAWLGPQDKQNWQPHITVLNKSTKIKADDLYRNLSQEFKPHPIRITGLDLWEYLGGPWKQKTQCPFSVPTDVA